jgi:hypothetical protein
MLLNRKKIGKANERLENKRARMSRIGCYGRDRLREKMKRKKKDEIVVLCRVCPCCSVEVQR